MPRTSEPILPSAQLIDSLKTEIDRLGWQTVRNQIIENYEQRLHDYFHKRKLSLDQISNSRLKRLTQQELLTLSLCFLTRIRQLHQQGLDTEDTIRQLSIDETELLERGYPKATIAKNHHPLYINLIRKAIANQEIVLNQQNSWLIPVPDKDTGELEEISIHYVQMYLKYDTSFYVNLKRSTTANNNIKQDHPQPVRLYPYLLTVRQLLNSNSYTELATAIAAASGRRFTEIVKGSFSLPNTSAHPYEYLFEGQLKKKDQAPAYLPYSIVPASQLLDAIARFRSLPKIQSLLSATSTKINQSINPAVKYQVEKHFQQSDLVRVLKGERSVTVQNLRGVYGEIAVHFFCPHRASFHRFLSLRLGHLIGDEAVDSPNSPSTEHYFHYYLVDESNKQIDSLGVLLDQPDSEEKTSLKNQQPQTFTNDKRTIVHALTSTKKRFNQFRGNNMTENDTLIAIMDEASRSKKLERELMEARARSSSLEAKLNSSVPELSVDRPSIAEDTPSRASDLEKRSAGMGGLQQIAINCRKQNIKPEKSPLSTPADGTSASERAPMQRSLDHNSNGSPLTNSEPHPVAENNTNNTNNAVLLLVKSMSQLTSKLELFLDRECALSADRELSSPSPSSSNSDRLPPSDGKDTLQPSNDDANSDSITSSEENQKSVDSSSSASDTIALLNRAINIIMAHNDRSEKKTDKWYIGINPLKDIINSQFTISRVVKQRKAEIDAHHRKHNINRTHNSHYHREQRYTDFFDFD